VSALEKIVKQMLCQQCKQIPNPPYRATGYDDEFFYCLNCLNFLKIDKSLYIKPSKNDMILLKKLQITCNNCKKYEVSYEKIEDLIKHEGSCSNNIVSLLKNIDLQNSSKNTNINNGQCMRCNEIMTSNHDCLASALKSIKDLKVKNEEYKKNYSDLNNSFKKQIKKLNERFDKEEKEKRIKIQEFI